MSTDQVCGDPNTGPDSTWTPRSWGMLGRLSERVEGMEAAFGRLGEELGLQLGRIEVRQQLDRAEAKARHKDTQECLELLEAKLALACTEEKLDLLDTKLLRIEAKLDLSDEVVREWLERKAADAGVCVERYVRGAPGHGLAWCTEGL